MPPPLSVHLLVGGAAVRHVLGARPFQRVRGAPCLLGGSSVLLCSFPSTCLGPWGLLVCAVGARTADMHCNPLSCVLVCTVKPIRPHGAAGSCRRHHAHVCPCAPPWGTRLAPPPRGRLLVGVADAQVYTYVRVCRPTLYLSTHIELVHATYCTSATRPRVRALQQQAARTCKYVHATPRCTARSGTASMPAACTTALSSCRHLPPQAFRCFLHAAC